jgi:hypothetical protein
MNLMHHTVHTTIVVLYTLANLLAQYAFGLRPVKPVVLDDHDADHDVNPPGDDGDLQSRHATAFALR